MSTSDIEEEVISFGKAEATSLLRASLITLWLNNGLSNFLSKMAPIEETLSIVLPKKQEKQLDQHEGVTKKTCELLLDSLACVLLRMCKCSFSSFDAESMRIWDFPLFFLRCFENLCNV